MKRKSILGWLVAMFCAVCCLFVGCVETNDPANNPTGITVELNKAQLTLEKLETYQLTATVDGKTVDAVWTSQDVSVATVENGLVTAKSEGTALIYATYQGEQERCVVTVQDHNLVPLITTNLDTDELNVVVGDDFEIATTVTYNGKPCNDAQVTYVLVGGDGVATVSGSTVTGVGEGNAQLAIEVAWRGTTARRTIAVNVVTDLAAYLIDAADLTLYATSLNGEKTSETLNVSVYEKGKLIAADGYTLANWDYDEDVIAFADGKITARGAGQTTLCVDVTSKSTGVTITAELPVTVQRVEVDKTETIELSPVDLTKQDNAVSLAAVFADLDEDAYSGQTIVKIEDVTNEGNVLEIPCVNGVVDAQSVLGERVWKVYTEKLAYSVRAIVATKVITSATEFNQMQTAYGNNANGDNGYAWNGYFALNGDVDFGGATIATTAFVNTDKTVGFQGTFNGRGFALANFVLAKYATGAEQASLFGNVGENGTVKNVTVKNYAITDGTATDNSATVAWSLNGGTLENINIVYTDAKFSLQHGYLAYNVSAGSTLKNINVFSSVTTDFGFGLSTLIPSLADVTLENVNVVISNNRLVGSEMTSKQVEPYVNFMYFNHSTYWRGDTKSMMSQKAVDWLSFGFYNANVVDGASVTTDGKVTVAESCAAEILNLTVISSLGGVEKIVNAPLREPLVDVFKFTAASDITVTPVSGDTNYVNAPQATGGMQVQVQSPTQDSRWTLTLPAIDFTKYESVSMKVCYNTAGGSLFFGNTQFVLGANQEIDLTIKDVSGTYKVFFGATEMGVLADDVKNGTVGFSFDIARTNTTYKYSTFVFSAITGKEKKETVTE